MGPTIIFCQSLVPLWRAGAPQIVKNASFGFDWRQTMVPSNDNLWVVRHNPCCLGRLFLSEIPVSIPTGVSITVMLATEDRDRSILLISFSDGFWALCKAVQRGFPARAKLSASESVKIESRSVDRRHIRRGEN